MGSLDWALPGRVMVETDGLGRLPGICRDFGQRGVVFFGRSFGRSEEHSSFLEQWSERREVLPWRYAGGEPTLAMVEEMLSVARGHGADWIVGIGGGSVMDAAKAVAGLMHAPRSVATYHAGQAIEAGDQIPFIAVPTTAGTGSEATPVSVLSNPEQCTKRSIRHPLFMARFVLLDASLLCGMPREVIAHSGMDALTQAIEAYLSRKATRWSDGLALEAVRLIHSGLLPFYENPQSIRSAAFILQGSFLAGLALSVARLGVVHGLAHPVGVRSGVPHGQVCAAALPMALAYNQPAVEPVRWSALQSVLESSDLIQHCSQLLEAMSIASPLKMQIPSDRDAMIAEVLASGSTAANPRKVSAADAERLIVSLYGGN